MKKLLVVLTVMMCTFVQAQKMKVASGNFDFLKGETELNLIMDYSSMTFYKEKMDENAYIKKRSNDILNDGKGKDEVDEWRKSWEFSKETRFPEKFTILMSRYLDIRAKKNNPEAKYTLNVKTIWIYPGGFMPQNAKVSTILTFTETANPNIILLQINSKEAPGAGVTGFGNLNIRITEGYAKTAKSLAKMLSKKVKK